MPEEYEVKISSIIIGKRHRKDFGDIDGLAKSIEERGLLQPIVIHEDGRLICGYRRILGFQKLGRIMIPARRINIDSIVRGEHDENVFRKDFTPSECVAIAREIEPVEKAAAQERQAAAGPAEGKGAKSGSEKFPEAVKGRARDKVAKAVGMSAPTLAKAKAVIEAAEADPSGALDDVVKEMDDSGNVDRAFKKATRKSNGETSKPGHCWTAITDNFADGKWHSLDEIIGKLGSSHSAEKIQKSLKEQTKPIKQGVFITQKEDRTITARDAKRGMIGGTFYRIYSRDHAVSITELTEKLSPIIKILDKQGRSHAATVNIPLIAQMAGTLQKFLGEWTSGHSASGASLDAFLPSTAPKEAENVV